MPPASGKKTPDPGVRPSTYALVVKLAAAVGVIPDTNPVKVVSPFNASVILAL